ncbi:hypothetical protein ACTXGL_02640 [Psychrobacter sp. T6-6]|uniref:hypothetical protein n=1 Tax=Psychrobacter sp. T6-6 TaxID=3457452 RepID=UPI003FD0E822
MFWIYILLLLMVLVGIYTISALIFDFYILINGRRIWAEILEVNTVEKSVSGLENYSLFDLRIKYSYTINSKEYTSTSINAFFDFTRENKTDILENIKITDNHIEIYVLKSFPQISMTSPLKVNKKILAIAITIGIILPSILSYLLIENQTIFDILLSVLN